MVHATENSAARAEVKRAALAYMVAGLLTFLLMGALGLTMRLDQAGFWVIDPASFYAVMTLHGAGMVSSVFLAGLGCLAHLLGERLELSPRLLWTALVIYLLGAGFALLATLVGGFGAGWTVLPPLPYLSRGTWSLWAAVGMYGGYFLIAFAFLLYCVEVLLASWRSYGSLGNALAWRFLFSGGRSGQEYLPPPSQIAAVVVAIDGIVTVAAGVVLLLPLFAQAAGLIGRVDPLFAKNFVFLFGHTFANLNIYMAAALVYGLLPRLTGRHWATTWPVALALNLVIVLILLPYFHHLYQDFVEPLPLALIGQFASYSVALPAFLVTILGGMSQLHRSGLRLSVPVILIAIGLWGWTFGGMGAVIDSTIAFNQVLHNTLWVPAHFHTYYLLGAASFTWAYMYWLTAELGQARETRFSRWAAGLYGVGGAGFILMFFLAGALSVPRRFAEHIPAWRLPDRISIPFVVLAALGSLWLAGEIFARTGAAWRGIGRSAAEAPVA
jgi:cytochrome c oxidase subunit 1